MPRWVRSVGVGCGLCSAASFLGAALLSGSGAQATLYAFACLAMCALTFVIGQADR